MQKLGLHHARRAQVECNASRRRIVYSKLVHKARILLVAKRNVHRAPVDLNALKMMEAEIRLVQQVHLLVDLQSLCPAGYECPDTKGDAPTPCQSGYYSAGGATSCTPCPPGYACPDTTLNLRLQCAVGSYSSGGAASCTPCPAGYQCLLTNGSSIQPCYPGWYSPHAFSAPEDIFATILEICPEIAQSDPVLRAIQATNARAQTSFLNRVR
uniref:Tyrosine-protein kinase ephrin type A/B receptor-like domain-containing protein n=1 Tax=Globisporangium ultimum (strain ATCC 200006 / CBS 805.95 / DAOM BR144) TaxID=431595 RepID=K3WJP3_GLOUD